MNPEGKGFSPARSLLLFAGVILAINLALHFADHRTGFTYLRSMFTAHGADDSWRVLFPALRLAMSGEKAIYTQLFFEKHIKYIDPPTALLLPWILQKLQPQATQSELLAQLNFVGWAATWAYLAISIMILVAPIQNQSANQDTSSFINRHSRLICVLSALLMGLLFYPATIAVALGQTQPSVILLFTIALWFWLHDSKRLAGAAIGIAALIKPTYLLFLIWGALRRERSFSLALAGAYASGLIASILIFGLYCHFEYIAVGQYISRHGESLYANQSMNGLLNRFFQPEQFRGWSLNSYPPYKLVIYAGTLINAILIIAIAIFLPQKSKRGNIFDFAGLALAVILSAPLAWEHNYAILIPVFALLFHQLPSARALIAASFILVGTAFEPLVDVTNPPWNLVQSYVLFGALLCGAIIYRHLRKEETESATMEKALHTVSVASL